MENTIVSILKKQCQKLGTQFSTDYEKIDVESKPLQVASGLIAYYES